MRRFLRSLAVAGVLSVAVAGVAACGGDDDGSQEPTSAPAQSSGSGASDGGSASGAGAKPGSTGPAFSGDVEQARAAADEVDEVYEGFGAAVAAGVASTKVPALQTLETADANDGLSDVCDLMSEEAQRQTIVYAKRSAGLADVDWTCEKATGLLLRRARQSGGLKRSLRAEVVGVNVDGDRATASIRFGGKGPVSTVPMVKEDGEWKLAASPSGGGGE